MRLLLVTAATAERAAVVRELPVAVETSIGPYDALTVRTGAGVVDVLAAGVGPVAAATATATALAHLPGYGLAVSLGIAGGFAGAGINVGDVVVADALCFADLGAHSPEGFLHHGELGWHAGTVHPPYALVQAARERVATAGLTVHTGAVLTLASMTGTAARAEELAARHGAVAEAMEGAGVAHAAAVYGIPVLELRTISNAVGDRDKATWDFPLALDALARAAAALLADELAGELTADAG